MLENLTLPGRHRMSGDSSSTNCFSKSLYNISNISICKVTLIPYTDSQTNIVQWPQHHLTLSSTVSVHYCRFDSLLLLRRSVVWLSLPLHYCNNTMALNHLLRQSKRKSAAVSSHQPTTTNTPSRENELYIFNHLTTHHPHYMSRPIPLRSRISLDPLLHTVPGPPQLLFAQEVLSEEEEKALISCIVEAPGICWRNLKHRRLQMWGGYPEEKMVRLGVPLWIEQVFEMCRDCVAGNHVLVNEYEAGQGILPHQDGSLYSGVVCIVSLGSSAMLRFSRGDRVMDVFLPRRSAIVFSGELYDEWMHSITEEAVDEITEATGNCRMLDSVGSHARSTRYSLTVRHV